MLTAYPHRALAIFALVSTATACSIDVAGLRPPPDASPPSDAGPPVDAPADGGGVDATACRPGEVLCALGILRRCTAGGWEEEPCRLGCAAEAARCATLVPSNLPSGALDPGCPEVAFTEDTTLNTSDCEALPFGRPSTVTQPDGAPALCLVCASRLSIPAGVTVRVGGGAAIVFAVTTEAQLDGTLDVSAIDDDRGPGGGAGGFAGRPSGRGPHRGEGGTSAPTGGGDSGGAGGGHCGAGGAGGGGGTAPSALAGGAMPADWMLSPLWGGSGGGAGGADGRGGLGGGGGGALQVSAGERIVVTGLVLAGGGRGRGGRTDSDPGGGGGGGSGGGVLLEAPEIAFEGGTIVATGGGGGGSAGSTWGGDGQPGAETLVRATGGGPGSNTALSSPGGQSGGGRVLDGDPGGDNLSTNGNGGGGGGGAGCILLRTADGTLPAGAAISSPSVAPGLRSAPVVRD